MTQDFNISIHALLFLDHKGEYCTSEQIAEKVCTNPVVIRRLMGILKKARLVRTREGIRGGYCIGEKGKDMTLLDVKQALKVQMFRRSGSREVDEDCLLSTGMGGLLDRLYAGMDETCDQYLKGITLGQLSDQIFGKNRSVG